MLTHKSLFISFALILALVCTGMLAVSAHTALPASAPHGTLSNPRGIPAIPALSRNNNLLSILDVRRYIHSKGFIGGPTLNGLPPVLQTLQLTNLSRVNSLLHLAHPQQVGNEQVYYAHLNGPFLVLPDLPLPILSTLIPNLSNLQAFLPHLSNLSSTGLLNLLPPYHPTMPDLSHWQTTSHAPAPAHASSHAVAQPAKNATVLSDGYEVFDAHTGNLLAWG